MAHIPPWQQAHLLKQAVSVWSCRLPRHTSALGLFALALLIGVAAADDYGIWGDTPHQRAIGEANLRHLAGESGLNLLSPPWLGLLGPIFEAPLALVERALGRDDSRSIHLSRYLLTHLFFLAAGFAGYLLAQRMFGSRWLALFALALFLLHPRIYAHSFFNSKDVPFLAMFMICLWLAHRAFHPRTPLGSGSSRDGTAVAAPSPPSPVNSGAFVLCGIAAGLLTNLRVSGLAFVAVVILMRLCDVALAGGWRKRRCAVASCALFAFASAATYYATMPYLWADPLERFGEIIAWSLAHPRDIPQLFQGQTVFSSQLPRSYLPVWFGITTPPLALALGAVGLAALVWRCVAARGEGGGGRLRVRRTPRWPARIAHGALLRNTPLRFELLVGACFVLSVLAVVVLQPTLYAGWRHFYFLWAPFVLLAASGLRTLAEALEGAGRRFLPLEVPAAAVVAALAVLGLGAIAVEMARMHPFQDRYFNVLATGPHIGLPLRQRYHSGPLNNTHRGFAHILEELADREEPDAIFNVGYARKTRWAGHVTKLGLILPSENFGLLSQRDQRRFKFDPNMDVDFYLRGDRFPFPPVLYERRLYGQTVQRVATPDLSRVDMATAGAYRTLYRDVTAEVPAQSGETDVYHSETSVTWVKESCPAGGVNIPQGMLVVPLDTARAHQKFFVDGVRVGGACLWQVALPEYAVGKILLFDGIGTLVSDAWLQESRRRHAAISAGPPAARSTFDVYVEDGALFYVRTPCVEADTEAPFFLHVFPVHLDDLPDVRRRPGFEALDFRFGTSELSWRTVAGDIFDGVCMATLELPDYAIANIATGQYTPDGDLWRVDIDLSLQTAPSR